MERVVSGPDVVGTMLVLKDVPVGGPVVRTVTETAPVGAEAVVKGV